MISGFSKTFYKQQQMIIWTPTFCENSEEKTKPIPKVQNEITVKVKFVPKFPRMAVVQKLPQGLWCAHFITFSK